MLEFHVKEQVFPVSVIETDGLGVTFLSRERVPVQVTLKVRDGDSNHARVNVSHLRQASRDSWLCFATIYEGTLSGGLTLNTALRRRKRFNLRLRAHSEELPGITATTRDISVDGMQLELRGPLDVGENVEVNLELDDGRDPICLWASVRWCRTTEPFQAGLQFVGSTRPQRERLRAFLKRRAVSRPRSRP